ncbi:MAG TPA: ATP-dependent metallopeptidase FtsH/Yme1/Tma family protein, partial [Bryobacteraceae bacterium]|nr:ATP-dependent metallopeptidase FtsH/Yme1/Tma family protein [Bryobacteraceae bacterium]
MERQQKHRWVFTALNVLTLVLAVYLANRLVQPEAPQQVPYSEFLGELRSGNLTDVQITERELI